MPLVEESANVPTAVRVMFPKETPKIEEVHGPFTAMRRVTNEYTGYLEISQCKVFTPERTKVLKLQ
jgi:hypothetical protein